MSLVCLTVKVLAIVVVTTLLWVEQGSEAVEPTLTLRLRSKKSVNWGADVVDNEDMGKRKSNKCCVFHKRKKFGESSSESDSGGDSPGGAQRRVPDKCSCDDDGSEGGPSGERGTGRDGVGGGRSQRRGPFSQRVQVQDQESGSAGFPGGWEAAGGVLRAGAPAAAAPGWEWVASDAARSADLVDLRQGAAAGGQLQAENRAPQ